jgi:hypothetical protein
MLTFMFIVNMFGALILLPALVHFLIPVEKYRRHEVDSERLELETGHQPKA